MFDDLQTWHEPLATQGHKIDINDDPGLALTYLWQGQIRSKLFIVLTPDVQMSGERLQEHWSSGSLSVVVFSHILLC